MVSSTPQSQNIHELPQKGITVSSHNTIGRWFIFK